MIGGEDAVSGDTASRGVGVAGIGDDTSRLHVLPSEDGVSTVASLVLVSVAGDEVLGGKNDVGGNVGLNGETVAQSLGGSESPARTALLLVANGVDGSGPLGAGVEGGGDGLSNGVNNGEVSAENVIHAGSEHLLGISESPGGELVVLEGSLP